jgi:hypothetical protein
VTCDAANDEELVFVQNSSMSRAALGNRPSDLRLRPMRRFKIEDDKIGKVGTVFVLAAKD